MVPINNYNIYWDKSSLILIPLPKLAKLWLYLANCQSLTWKPSIGVQDVHIVQLSWSFFN